MVNPSSRQVLTTHRYPRPWLRKIERIGLALAEITAGAAIVLEITLAFIERPLLCGMAVFTAILLIPLSMRTVLHPEIDVTADGLILHPMLLRAQFVAWEHLTRIVAHPLVVNDPAMGRTLHGKNYRPREGVVIIVDPRAGLSPAYRLVGGLAGAGTLPAFAISSTTHTDYPVLLEVVVRHVDQSRIDFEQLKLIR